MSQPVAVISAEAAAAPPVAIPVSSGDESPDVAIVASARIQDLAPDADGLKTDSLAASVVILLVLTVVQRLVGFVRGILFCRWLDAEQLGQWDMAYGFLMLAAPLAVFGLPGSLGRYVEHYRQRGQLRPFLRRTTACTLLLAVLAVLAVAWGRTWLSDLVFGSASHREMMLLLAIGLGVVIVYNFLISLYTALRQVKLVSAIQFAGSVLFALVGVGLLLAWRTGPESVVIAFLAACLLASAVPLLWWGSIRPRPSPAAASLPNRSLWAKVLPFALSLWVTNWLSNLFSLADRFMIVHYGGLPPADALNMVGQYHTARIFPVLFVGVAELLAAVITPHLSSDWEAGRSARVSQRLGLILKGSGVGLVAASTLVLVVAPVLFNVVWQERYGDGLLVLPWALVCSVWTGLALISCNYVWCAEKSRYISLTLLAGLALNVAMNLFLLPYLGLLGAVLAAAAARLAALGLLWWFAWRLGMQVDRGLVIVAALPLLLCLGPWAAMIALVAVLLGLVPGAQCFNRWEKDRLADMARQAWLSLPRRANERV